MQYNIISTGSQGNAVVINNIVLIDCGVTFKALRPFYKQLKLVLLTHIHSDHFNKATLHTLSRERPSIRFGCCKWLVPALVGAGVRQRQIDVLEPGLYNNYGVLTVIPFETKHNVPNCGYKLLFNGEKMVYATDCNNLNGVFAKDYDLYMIEANYDENIIEEKIRQKKEEGLYAYEVKVKQNHLSKQKCDDFIYKNIGQNGQYVYMHCHEDKEGEDDYNRENSAV